MPIVKVTTVVQAPIERVFDLARCIDLHEVSMTTHGEKAIAGVTNGLIELGQSVTWQAKHFGVRQTLTSKITLFERPVHFRDSMVRGTFQRFDHDHYFAAEADGTRMTDVFDYISPFGVLGRLADRLFLERYMRRLLEERNQIIKAVAESEQWKRFLVC